MNVIKVTGLDPNVWQGNPQNIYVGRKVVLRSGKFAGAVWMNCGFANEYRFDADDTEASKRAKLFAYVQGLKVSLERSAILRKRFSQLAGKTLGCWCVNWNGASANVPLCHAAWLARIVQFVNEDRERPACSVSIDGTIRACGDHEVDTDTICIMRKVK